MPVTNFDDFDQYGSNSVPLRAPGMTPTSTQYDITDEVPIPDGVYVAVAGIIIIKAGVLDQEIAAGLIFDQWGTTENLRFTIE